MGREQLEIEGGPGAPRTASGLETVAARQSGMKLARCGRGIRLGGDGSRAAERTAHLGKRHLGIYGSRL